MAAGSGTSVQDINKLVKMHRQMADMMKSMGKKRGMLGSLFGGGAAAGDARRFAGRRRRLPPGLPPMPAGGLPGLPDFRGGLPRGLPGIAPRPSRPAQIEEEMNIEHYRRTEACH